MNTTFNEYRDVQRCESVCKGAYAPSRFEAIYATLFIALFCMFYLIGQQQLFAWAIVFVDICSLLLRKSSLPVLYSAFLIGNEAASVLIIMIWFMGSTDLRFGAIKSAKIDKEIIFLGSTILAVTFAQAWKAGTIANSVISICYLCLVCFLAFACSQSVKYESLFRCTRLFVYCEFIVSLLICFKEGIVPGDAHYGTILNAHFFGLFCLIAFVLVIHGWRIKLISKMELCILAAMLVFMMWDADAKSALGAGIVCLVFYAILRAAKEGPGTISALLWLVVVLFIVGSLVLAAPGVREAFTADEFPLSSFFKDSVYDSGTQNKFDYFMGTVNQMIEDGHIIFGYGLGTYGSRFANMLGYTYTYRDPSAFNELAANFFSSRMIPEYIPYASAYNADVVSRIQWLSAVLTYPFSSLVALLGETGLLGVGLVGLMLCRLRLGSCSQALVSLFIGACITDLYFDHIQVVGLLIMVIAGLEQMRHCKSKM